jgi:hypothetical protein
LVCGVGRDYAVPCNFLHRRERVSWLRAKEPKGLPATNRYYCVLGKTQELGEIGGGTNTASGGIYLGRWTENEQPGGGRPRLGDSR